MQKELWLLPVGALALLTFFVLLQIPIRRFYAGFIGKVSPDDFKFGESTNVPQWVSIANRNYMNLLEMPLLFYLICLIQYLTEAIDPLNFQLAWIYVGFRFLHSLIHLTYNNVIHRLTIFAASNFVLFGIWANYFWKFLGVIF
ncbi:MAPEG family protein [Leptospira sp. WS58.C1]|uniref:MAPEG family protein n=1 Tax=Leptospira TaxID=171 RepID=UPI0002BF3E14|nr:MULTISPECIES: MAPEG family protein [unclassified Leptospira]EMK00893.1 MAPEG family protein [Leptospira sp. B5-022]MCR1794241.1 MAPEG family protein [Leptospira sp. id769339]